MDTTQLLVFITLFPAMVQASCADIESCSLDMNPRTGYCKKLDAYLECVKAPQCQGVAGQIAGLEKRFQSACNSSTPDQSGGSYLLSKLGFVDTSFYISISNCSQLAQCTTDKNYSDFDLSSGDYTKLCRTLEEIVECWNRARDNCSLPANLIAKIDKSKSEWDDKCTGRVGVMYMFMILKYAKKTGLPGCEEFKKCYFKEFSTKNGEIDMSTTKKIANDIPAMCRMISTLIFCIEHGDSKCEVVKLLATKIAELRKDFNSRCEQYAVPRATGSLTTWTLLVDVLPAFVVILHN